MTTVHRTKRAPVAERASASAWGPATLLSKIAAGKTSREYKSKQVIFVQGDPGDAVFYIEKGKVKLTVVSTRGKEAIITILESGAFFGEGCLTSQPLRLSTATTINDAATIIRVEKRAMVEMLHREATFAEFFIAYLLSRNARIEEDLVDQLFNSCEKRLARVLLLMAQFGKDSTPSPLITKVSQETLAEMVGTTRSRVSHFMNKFRKLGFIQYNASGLHVHSALLNIVLYDSVEA